MQVLLVVDIGSPSALMGCLRKTHITQGANMRQAQISVWNELYQHNTVGVCFLQAQKSPHDAG
jgi:hypothetical protein